MEHLTEQPKTESQPIDRARVVAMDKRIKTHLDRMVRYEGELMTYGEMADKLVAKGYKAKKIIRKPSMAIQEQRSK